MAASGIIFSGNDVKTLKSNIDLFGNAKILSGNTDPTSVATNAPKGSIYLNTSTGFLYRKTDAGSTINWIQLQDSESAITALTGDVIATGPGSVSATVNSVGGSSSTNVHNAELLANAATNANTNSAIVRRDGSGNFSASTIIASLTGHASLDLALTGGTMSGAINMGSNKVTSVTDPTSAQDAATKNYVDNALSQLNPLQATYAGSTTNIVGTYSNGVAGIGATFTVTATGAFTIDGTTPPVLSRILLKDQSSGFQNGVYDLTVAGTTGVSPVLTRSLDYDTATDMNAGDLIPVINGTINTKTSWLQTAVITTVGTDNLTFTQWTANPSSYPLKSAGDINETSFSAANNQSAAANVTGLVFANATVRSAQVILSVFVNATSSLYETFQLLLIQKGASWEMAQSSVGDNSGFIFSVTTAGQVQYTDSNYSGFSAATIKFRAITTTV